MNIWIKSSLIALVATSISYVIAILTGWTHWNSLNWLEVTAVYTSYICTFMCVHQTRWNYPIGVLTTLLYTILFYQWEMYAIGAFNLYLVFSLTYGWFRWGPDNQTRPVTKIEGRWWLGYISIGLAIWFAISTISTYFQVPITNVEIIITVLSGVAQFMLDNKKIENWIFWIAVNLLSIWFYYQGGLYLVTIQYVFFLFNALYGYYKWKTV